MREAASTLVSIRSSASGEASAGGGSVGGGRRPRRPVRRRPTAEGGEAAAVAASAPPPPRSPPLPSRPPPLPSPPAGLGALLAVSWSHALASPPELQTLHIAPEAVGPVFPAPRPGGGGLTAVSLSLDVAPQRRRPPGAAAPGVSGGTRKGGAGGLPPPSPLSPPPPPPSPVTLSCTLACFQGREGPPHFHLTAGWVAAARRLRLRVGDEVIFTAGGGGRVGLAVVRGAGGAENVDPHMR